MVNVTHNNAFTPYDQSHIQQCSSHHMANVMHINVLTPYGQCHIKQCFHTIWSMPCTSMLSHYMVNVTCNNNVFTPYGQCHTQSFHTIWAMSDTTMLLYHIINVTHQLITCNYFSRHCFTNYIWYQFTALSRHEIVVYNCLLYPCVHNVFLGQSLYLYVLWRSMICSYPCCPTQHQMTIYTYVGNIRAISIQKRML